ncbi:hypothetical protein BU15DRAFT_66029 [Melanogaster broomeanus]|nr:hypothetical protein BU15DRAFT_66029 [Melanogaster broomeanus]
MATIIGHNGGTNMRRNGEVVWSEEIGRRHSEGRGKRARHWMTVDVTVNAADDLNNEIQTIRLALARVYASTANLDRMMTAPESKSIQVADIAAFELYTKTDEDAIRPTNVVDLPAETAKRRVLEVVATNRITKEVQSR